MHPNEPTLNDYVDNALGPAERADLERHLAACAECRELVDDLREIGQRIATLEPMQPPAHTWNRIERELQRSARLQPTDDTGDRPARASRVTRWTWLAAAAVLVVGTIVGLRVISIRNGAPPSGATDASGAAATDGRELAQSVASELLQAEQHYQKAISGLEQIANAEKSALDPNTAATVRKSLAVVDQAISESRAALKIQPDNEPAQQSLLESFKAKMALLQDTVALINEMRKGNDAGAAQIVSGLKRKS